MKAATAMNAPRDVVPAEPEFVRATPIQTVAKERVERPEMDFPKRKYCSNTTHGVVMTFASLMDT